MFSLALPILGMLGWELMVTLPEMSKDHVNEEGAEASILDMFRAMA